MSSHHSNVNGYAPDGYGAANGSTLTPSPKSIDSKRLDAEPLLASSTGHSSSTSRSGGGGGAGATSPVINQRHSPQMAQQQSSNLESGSLSRANRPSSLYIPMEDTPRGGLVGDGTTTGNTPSWPFRGGLKMDDRRPSTTAYPSSPSLINPSYADLPNPPKHFTDYGLIGTPQQQVIPEPELQYSSVRVDSSAVDMGARAITPNARRGLTGGRGDKGADGVRGVYNAGTDQYEQTASGRLAQRLDTPVAWLVLYFGFNLGLTLYNKLVLQGFPFPWTLTAIQMLSGTIGTQIALNRGFFVQARLTTREGAIMIAFSFLYTVNIAVSNLSLHLVTVPFHQVVRAMTPLFTLIISAVAFRKRHSRDTYLSLLPVILGVVFATYGDYSFTAWGFILTLLGTLLAALKTIVTNRVQVGRLKLHPLDLLIRMSPLAFCQCVFFGWTTGELDRVRIYGATEMTSHKAWALAINGAIAFGLNVVSFTANKKTSALTMTVAANVKQVLTIVLAVVIFNVALNPTNMFGITLTLAGGAWYAKVELQEKARTAALNSANALSARPN